MPASAVSLPAISSAALYGRGIFTTLAVYHGKPFLWDLHEKRLRENALKVGIKLSEAGFESIQNSLLELIEVNRINNGRARITLFDSHSSRIWHSAENKGETCVLMTTAERREVSKENLKLTISPYRINSTSPLTGVKSCNYLENILALESANKLNFDEAVRLNERGEVVSAIMANLFWVSGGEIFTPAINSGALNGTTRQFIAGLVRKLGFVVKEKLILLEELQTADEIFLTSAGLGVCPAQSLDNQILSDKIPAKIQTAFFDSING